MIDQVQTQPVPSEEEAAAIVAALTLLWAGAAAPEAPSAEPSWRFSGRWWSQPVPMTRPRPWRA
jgi:hypothetical protein